ncbi:hypothetical protein FRC07_008749 [Ceratobasidium sp. 392]|nr:hypothetical protein FRC07_008749 [Ceratobasidium sp. 392]
MVAGLEKPTSGSIIFGLDEEGRERTGVGEMTEKRHGGGGIGRQPLGLVPQRDVLFPELTCYQTVLLWRDIKLPRARSSSLVPLETSQESLEQLLDDCDLRAKIHSPAATLSGGQKRKLQLAAGLVGGSRIVLVDEATSGVDPLSRRAIWKALMKARESRCVVFTTHFLDEADLLADEIAILAAPGKLLAQGSPVSLKSKLGDGYAIRITRVYPTLYPPFDSVLSIIRVHAPLAFPDDTDPDTYILRSKSTQVVGRVLDALEERKVELGVNNYDVQNTTMETIFLKLMGDGKRSGGSTPKRGYLNAMRDSGYLSVDDSIFTRSSSVEINEKHEPLALSDGRKTSPFRQALTGFHKRLLVLRRSWLSYALLVVIAIAGTCVPIFFMGGRTSTCSFAKDLGVSSPLYLPEARAITLALFGKNVADKYEPVISPPNLLKSLNVTQLPQAKMPDSRAFSQTIQQTYRNLSLGGLDVHYGQATIAWEASPGSRSGPTLLNLASNVLANAALGRNSTGPRIIAYFQDLPRTRIIGMAMALKWEGFFGAAMGLWPAFFVLYVSVERCSSVQAMQLSNGMTPAGLWLGHLLFDLPWITLISTAVCIVFGTATNQFYALGVFWVVLELYGIAGALFAYVVSTFVPRVLSEPIIAVNSPLAGFAVAGGYNGMMSMVRAAFVSMNVFSLLCDGLGNFDSNSPSNMAKFGEPIVYLIGWIVFLFSLLMWIEYGKPLPQWFRFRRAVPATETDIENVAVGGGAFDAEVKAEAERVRQSDDTLRLLDVGKTFPGPFAAVENASFGVDNEIFAMLGPNGAGKTTTFNIIRGNIRPTRGDVLINGTSIVDKPVTARLSLGVTPQFSAVDSQLTVREHMIIYGSLKGLRGGDLDRNVDLLMEATALTQYRDRLASKLSGGNARKLSLALALIGNPRVLLIDEYSTGVDAATKRAMWKTLRRVSSGKAVVITTHSMEEASALASRVGILSKRMLAIGTPNSLVSRFSTYEVHFTVRTPLEASRADTLMSQFPGSRRAEDVATRYEVPIGQTSLASLFKTLSGNKNGEEGRVNDGPELEYTVERLGMESVFLKVIGERGVGVVIEAEMRQWWKFW